MPSHNPVAVRPALSEHRPQLDGLRFFAFLGVFLLHVNSGKLPAGHLGVPLFFVISGFLITRILLRHESGSLRHDLGVFYARRTLRIFPLYYGLILVLLVCGGLKRPELALSYTTNLGIYANQVFHDGSGHFWSLAVEEQFYLLFPLLVLTLPSRRRVPMLVVVLLACAASRYALDWAAPSFFTFILPNVAGVYLLAGAIAGYRDVSRPATPSSTPRLTAAVVLTALVVLGESGWRLGGPFTKPLWPDLAALAFAWLVLELWRSDGLLARLLSFRPLAYLGKISYGLYLFHVYPLHWIYSHSGQPLLDGLPWLVVPDRARLIATFALTVLAAAASWHLLESPILALKSRLPYTLRPSPPREEAARSASRPTRPAPAWTATIPVALP